MTNEPMSPRPQPSLRKAAILLASLDDETAERLIEQMSPEQAEWLRARRGEFVDLDQSEQATVIHEFFRQSSHGKAHRRESMGLDLTSAPPAAMQPPPATIPFRFLQAARGTRLSNILQSEHPQTIALVISHLTEEQASEVLASFDAETQVDVIRRLVALDQTDPEILREVERGLKTRVAELIQDERRRAAGLAAVADILRVADPNIRRSILENLAEHDRPLARRLGRRDATFDDVERLADADLATVIARCDPEVLRLALAGASPRLADRVVNLLATREHKALRRALDRWEPTRLSDVEAAQAEVAKVAEQLFAEGMIELPGVSGSSLLLAA